MNLTELTKLKGKTVSASVRQRKKEFPITGVLDDVRELFGRVEGRVCWNGTRGAAECKWFNADKITAAKK